MKRQDLSESYFDLWLLIGKINHSIMLIRQKELNKYEIPVRQTHVLRTIQALGPKATFSEIAREVDRKNHVISKQAINMEKDGLIIRVKDKPKSKLLRLELTQKGRDLARVSNQSKSIQEIFSSLSEEDRQQMKLLLTKLLTKVEKYSAKINKNIDN
jgi:DNA-binding MarR family transcriptional regulator